jgi:hypothetical protein
VSAAAPDSAAWLTIGQGEVTYTQDEAEAVLAGFAFATRPLTWPSSFSPPSPVFSAG